MQSSSPILAPSSQVIVIGTRLQAVHATDTRSVDVDSRVLEHPFHFSDAVFVALPREDPMQHISTFDVGAAVDERLDDGVIFAIVEGDKSVVVNVVGICIFSEQVLEERLVIPRMNISSKSAHEMVEHDRPIYTSRYSP
jgi:hypothetical protein